MYIKNRKNEHETMPGFTMVELLLVMAIIVVLISITIGLSRVAGYKSDVAKSESVVQQAANALEQYRSDRGSYPGDKDYPLDNYKNGSTDPQIGTSYELIWSTNLIGYLAKDVFEVLEASQGSSVSDLYFLLDGFGRDVAYAREGNYSYYLWSYGRHVTDPENNGRLLHADDIPAIWGD